MKNITRLALAFAMAAITCLSPMAHADETQPGATVEPGVNPVRSYAYGDKDGEGKMVVKDASDHPNGKWIYVLLYYKGYVFYGKGWRSLASEETSWSAYCEFWLYGSGVKAKFQGHIGIKPISGEQFGYYYLNGSGPPYRWETIPD